MAFEDYWNQTHEKYGEGKPAYDDWLDKYASLISVCTTPVLDLGCGTGNDALYLSEKGKKVIALDYSEVAVNLVKQNVRGVNALIADISKPLPFEDHTFDLIIADLSLHYFSGKTTIEIMKEIRRILKVNGCLLARVNSITDLNFGAGQGEKIEDNYYFVDGYNKRFFSVEDAEKYFSIIGAVETKEATMLRYSKPKEVLEVLTKKISE